MLTGPWFYFTYFLPLLCNGVTSVNLIHDGNTEDLMELSMLVHCCDIDRAYNRDNYISDKTRDFE